MAQTQNKCYASALRMLARREHSQLEIQQKLQQKDFEHADIQKTIALLIEQGYQSDERFAEAFIRMRYNQGKGPIKIVLELKQRGVDQFDLSVYDWRDRAKQVAQKKFGSEAPKDYKEKAKRQRFLQSRGFDFEQIRYAV